MAWWQVVQTMSVFLRMAAMICAHAGWGGWWAVGEDRFLLPFQGYATEPDDQCFLFARLTVASKQVRSPFGVAVLALYLVAIFVTVERCLAASVLSIEVLATHCSRFSR